MGNVEKELWFLFIQKHSVSTKYMQYICNFQIADTVMNKMHIIKSLSKHVVSINSFSFSLSYTSFTLQKLTSVSLLKCQPPIK